MMDGRVFRFGSSGRLSAFIAHRSRGCVQQLFRRGTSSSGGRKELNPKSGLAVILLPGLTDGLLTLDYTFALDKMLASLEIGLVQPILTSSYRGYGTSTLQQDCVELDELIDTLVNQQGYESTDFILWGHSTGAQISVGTFVRYIIRLGSDSFVLQYVRANKCCSPDQHDRQTDRPSSYS